MYKDRIIEAARAVIAQNPWRDAPLEIERLKRAIEAYDAWRRKELLP
jgi:hypothetical protein